MKFSIPSLIKINLEEMELSTMPLYFILMNDTKQHFKTYVKHMLNLKPSKRTSSDNMIEFFIMRFKFSLLLIYGKT